MPGPAKYCLVIRSVVPPADRDAFDEWYRTDHMPKALVGLGTLGGRRYWSDTDPTVHYAVYDFAEIDTPRQIKRRADGQLAGPTEFDQAWPNVARTREVIALAP